MKPIHQARVTKISRMADEIFSLIARVEDKKKFSDALQTLKTAAHNLEAASYEYGMSATEFCEKCENPVPCDCKKETL